MKNYTPIIEPDWDAIRNGMRASVRHIEEYTKKAIPIAVKAKIIVKALKGVPIDVLMPEIESLTSESETDY